MLDDGGSAFPYMGSRPVEGLKNVYVAGFKPGMSLLDWFAGMTLDSPPLAITKLMYEEVPIEEVAAAIAEWRYMIADACLTERKKRLETEDADQGDVPGNGA